MSRAAPVPSAADVRVAVVTVNYRTADLTVECVRSLAQERARLPQLRVLVVDGGSGDDSASRIEGKLAREMREGWVQMLALPINGGFGWANNHGINQLLSKPDAPEYIHLLNPDCVIAAGAVEALLSELVHNQRVAAVGSQLLEMDGSEAGSAFSFPTLRGEFARGARTGFITELLRVPPNSIYSDSEQSKSVDWVTGASVMFRTEALRQVGLFDHGFFLYYEEVELMWRLRRAGWDIRHVPSSRVKHIGGAATGVHGRVSDQRIAPRKPAYWYESRRRYFARTRGLASATMATVAWGAGHLIWRARQLLGLSAGPITDHEARDQMRFGWPRRQDRAPAIANIGADPPSEPAWMDLR